MLINAIEELEKIILKDKAIALHVKSISLLNKLAAGEAFESLSVVSQKLHKAILNNNLNDIELIQLDTLLSKINRMIS